MSCLGPVVLRRFGGGDEEREEERVESEWSDAEEREDSAGEVSRGWEGLPSSARIVPNDAGASDRDPIREGEDSCGIDVGTLFDCVDGGVDNAGSLCARCTIPGASGFLWACSAFLMLFSLPKIS